MSVCLCAGKESACLHLPILDCYNIAICSHNKAFSLDSKQLHENNNGFNYPLKLCVYIYIYIDLECPHLLTCMSVTKVEWLDHSSVKQKGPLRLVAGCFSQAQAFYPPDICHCTCMNKPKPKEVLR